MTEPKYTDAQCETVSRYLRGCGKNQAADIIDSLLAERQAAMQGQGGEVNADKLAERFHEAYERLAHRYGYRTREKTSVPWKDVPLPNKQLMTAVCEELLSFVAPSFQPPQTVRSVSDEADAIADMISDGETP